MGLFSKEIETMDDLFVHQLEDIYYAEKRIVGALPEMIAKATSPQLKSAFESHLGETRNLEGYVRSRARSFVRHGRRPHISRIERRRGPVRRYGKSPRGFSRLTVRLCAASSAGGGRRAV
jgi:hypothetical protein